jgi:hypothetical protein
MTSNPVFGCAAAFAAFLGFSAPVNAQNLNDQGICPGVQVYGENIPVRLMRVVGSAPRVHFIEDTLSKPKSSCPSSAAECQRKGFVVPGDDLLAGWTKGAYLCTVYVSPNAKLVKGQFPETNGYLPQGALQAVPVPAAQLTDWQGKWTRSAEAEITITVEAGKVKLAGQATYGAHDAGRVARGAINIGELEGEGFLKGNLMAVGEDYTDPTKPLGNDRSECRAKLHLFGRYLLVEDSGGCGGNNVSFTGIYVRLK